MLKKWFKGKKAAEESPTADSPEEKSPEEKSPGEESSDGKASEIGLTRESATKEETAEENASRWSLFKGGLAKTRKGLANLFTFRRALDAEYLNEIEAALFRADFGPETVAHLIDGEGGLRAAWKDKRIEEAEQVPDYLRRLLKEMLLRRDSRLQMAATGPTVILVAGVNGAGKTTSIAKLTKRLRDDGSKVVLAAADTFRAAAVEQLTIWSERLGVDIVTGKPEADPASVAYEGAERALAENADVLVVDTAGRLHNQKNLMRELVKIRNVLAKKIEGAPHESLLVLDATTGQNALSQARSFKEEVQITGIVLAKLDGTAKGGIVVNINNLLDIPVKLVGLGEGIDDMDLFDIDRFVDALLEE